MRPVSTMKSAGHGLAFGAQHLSFEELAKRAVRGQPREFFAWRGAERLVSGEPIEEVRTAHLATAALAATIGAPSSNRFFGVMSVGMVCVQIR